MIATPNPASRIPDLTFPLHTHRFTPNPPTHLLSNHTSKQMFKIFLSAFQLIRIKTYPNMKFMLNKLVLRCMKLLSLPH